MKHGVSDHFFLFPGDIGLYCLAIGSQCVHLSHEARGNPTRIVLLKEAPFSVGVSTGDQETLSGDSIGHRGQKEVLRTHKLSLIVWIGLDIYY